tara:strand:- start:8365 stop:11922 length:3558 start_codon:yes stop_codon:yes gene_type:complete
MAVGRISGPLLKANLERNGINLAFETDLLYLDVINQRVGVKTSSPAHALDINGTTRSDVIEATSELKVGDITITNNTISSSNNVLTLGTADTIVYQNKLIINSIEINDNTIKTIDSNANIEISTSGTGTIELQADTNITGNIHATGNITADGDITIGDANTDTIIINAEVASNIIPDVNNTYNLGSDPGTGGKEWKDIWVNNFYASTIVSTDLTIDGIDLTLRQGNIIYVAENGNDTNSGTHPQDPYASVAQALSTATLGDTVFIYPGIYTEIFPLTVPAGVTVKGQGLRAVTIQPTVGTNTNTAFLLNGETTIEDLMITNFYSPGYAFEFAPGFTVITRSPYIRNVTVITKGSVTTVEDPRGFNQGDAGGGAYIDGSVATESAGNKEASMLFHAATFITPGVDTITATNGVRIEWLNCFTYFANRSVYAVDGTTGKYNDGKTRIRLGGVTGTFAASDTVTFTSTDASTVAVATVESVNGDVLIIDGKYIDLIGFDKTPQSISNGTGATATEILNYDLRDFGAEIRMIGSASVYGNFGIYGDGPGILVYAIGHNLAYIGTGKETTNDPTPVIQANEVVELNNAQIRYNTVDHKGNFRVGDNFFVDQETGTVSFNTPSLNILTTNGVTIGAGGDVTYIDGTKIETGDFRISANTIETLTQDFNINSATGVINLQNNTYVVGDLAVTGDVSIGGNIQIGNEASDTIQFVAGIASDLLPAEDAIYNIGSPTKEWNNVYISSLDIDSININGTLIQTNVSNADLELRANGTGSVVIPNNDFEVTGSTQFGGTATFDSPVTMQDNVEVNGAIIQAAGTTTLTGTLEVQEGLTVNDTADFGNIIITQNIIATSESNSDLELRANGTGAIVIPSNNVVVSNNLTVLGELFVSEISSTGTLTANRFSTGNILIDDNFITTTISNSNLELRANGTGSITIDNLAFNSNVISASGDLVLTASTGIIEIDSTDSLILPKGITADRPVLPQSGMIRYNTESAIFEGYNGEWLSLSQGVIDQDGNTYITAELTPGANDNVIRFYNNGALTADLNATRFRVNELEVDDIKINNNEITTYSTNVDLELSANGTGSVVIDNFSIKNNTITNIVTNSKTIFSSTGQGYFKFSGSRGVVLPSGPLETRPAPVDSELGLTRYNSTAERLEIYDGVQWVSVAGSASGISRADAEDIAISYVLTLG